MLCMLLIIEVNQNIPLFLSIFTLQNKTPLYDFTWVFVLFLSVVEVLQTKYLKM